MNNYRVIFRGDVAHGYKVGDVKEKIASMLKEDSGTIDKLFSGETLIIKKDPDLTKCEKVRKMFLAVGAVCYIEDPENQIQIDLDVIIENPSQQQKTNDSSPSTKKSAKIEDVKGKIVGKIADVKSLLISTKDKANQMWAKASASIKADMAAGDIKILLKNKYLLSSIAISFAVLIVAIVSFTYQGKAMPLTEKNYNQLYEHIGFVEKAFTPAELENMKKNPADFWEYLLVEPIEKMGYEFEATINGISEDLLSDDFNAVEKQRALTILQLVTPDRNNLLEHGIISGNLKENLDKISKKMGI